MHLAVMCTRPHIAHAYIHHTLRTADRPPFAIDAQRSPLHLTVRLSATGDAPGTPLYVRPIRVLVRGVVRSQPVDPPLAFETCCRPVVRLARPGAAAAAAGELSQAERNVVQSVACRPFHSQIRPAQLQLFTLCTTRHVRVCARVFVGLKWIHTGTQASDIQTYIHTNTLWVWLCRASV